MITKSTTDQYICVHPHIQCYTYYRIVCKWQSKAKWNTLNYSPFKRIRVLFVQFFADIIDLGFEALHDINIWIFLSRGQICPGRCRLGNYFLSFWGDKSIKDIILNAKLCQMVQIFEIRSPYEILLHFYWLITDAIPVPCGITVFTSLIYKLKNNKYPRKFSSTHPLLLTRECILMRNEFITC